MKRLMLIALLALPGCREEAANRPPPVALTAEAVGHYCQMDLLVHPGPKAQVHLAGIEAPLFFSQVRDALAFQRMPEQEGAITAIYVNDMGAAQSWQEPGVTNWIDAESAVYVVGSAARGGMDAPELVPFSSETAAQGFAGRDGGAVMAFAAIGDRDVLEPVAPAEDSDEASYADSLRKLSDRRQN
ncbi:MAG: Nitrous oxide reductase maturation protein outer-rane lipoprotein NosL [Cereibacter sp.]|jgi:copper chaperone NosL|nr:Nitrous oxide reductase maturation protein outer-rane lipoprotein NosL [Cereibacter sp.]